MSLRLLSRYLAYRFAPGDQEELKLILLSFFPSILCDDIQVTFIESSPPYQLCIMLLAAF